PQLRAGSVLRHRGIRLRHHRPEPVADAVGVARGGGRRHLGNRDRSGAVRVLRLLRTGERLDHPAAHAGALADPGNVHGPDSRVTGFALAAGLGGVSGVLYVSWGNYINPASMGLYAATLPVIWTAVGGRSSLLAVALSTVGLKWLADTLAVRGGGNAFLIMGALLLATMLFFPAGIVVSLARLWRR